MKLFFIFEGLINRCNCDMSLNIFLTLKYQEEKDNISLRLRTKFEKFQTENDVSYEVCSVTRLDKIVNLVVCCSCDRCLNAVAGTLKMCALIHSEIGEAECKRYSDLLEKDAPICLYECDIEGSIVDVILSLYEVSKTIEKSQENKMIEQELNVLLLAHDQTELIFLKHLGKGKFENKEVFGVPRSIYPMTFKTNQGIIKINVIHEYYGSSALIDDVDGIIAIPPSKVSLEHDSVKKKFTIVKRLVDSFTPTYIFQDMEKIWEQENKKEQFLEPFKLIIKQCVGATIV